MRITFKTLFACAVAICSSTVFGLGVSDIKVQSALNQPLVATVDLRDAQGIREGQLSVHLASVADFKTVGVDYIAMLTELEFEVRYASGGAKDVMITTRLPVREPYLNFLVEVKWPNGRIVKEYAAFLDPVFSDSNFKASTESIAQQITRSHTEAPRPQPVDKAQPKPESRLTRANDTQQQVMVLQDDTLWGISQRFKPPGVTVQQTMLAIKSSNPNAFIAGNMNGLKAGYLLNIPAESAIRNVPLTSAVRETERAEQLWNNQAQAAVASNFQSRPVAELKLAAGTSSGSVDGSQALEINDALSSENVELKDRLQALESQVSQLQRLLELKNQQLAQVQTVAEAVAEASGPEVTQAAQAVADLDSGIDSSAVDAAQAGEEVDSGSNVDAGTALQLEPLKALGPVDLVEPKGLFEQAWFRLVVLSLALIGLVIVLLQRRRQVAADEFTVQDSDVSLVGSEQDDASYTMAPEAAPETQTQLAADEQQALEQLFETMPYQDAMMELEQRIENEAHRADLRLFLLQKAANSGDKDRFVDNFRTLDAIGKETDVATARRILVSVTGGSAWLEADSVPTMIEAPIDLIEEPQDEMDDFFKQIATEEELTDEIEALLMASEGATSLDQQDFEDFDIDSLGTDAESLDELMDDAELDASVADAIVPALADEFEPDEVASDGDPEDLDFDSTMILAAAPELSSPAPEPPSNDIEDDELDFDLGDLSVYGEDADTVILDDSAVVAAEREPSDADGLDFNETVALDMDRTAQVNLSDVVVEPALGSDTISDEIAGDTGDELGDGELGDDFISLDDLGDEFDLLDLSDDESTEDDEDELLDEADSIDLDGADLDDLLDISEFESDDSDADLDLSALADVGDEDDQDKLFAEDEEALIIDSESAVINADRSDDLSFFAEADDDDQDDSDLLDLTSEIDLDALAGDGFDSIDEDDEEEYDGDYEDFSSLLDGLDEDTSSAGDEISTKLELAKAFVEMGDKEASIEIINEVLQEGDVVQQAAARELLDNLGE